MSYQGQDQKQKLTVGARLAVSDDLGLIKIVESPGGNKWDATRIVNTWGKADRGRAVHFLKHYIGNELLISRKDGQVEIMNAKTGQLSELISKGKGRTQDNFATTVEKVDVPTENENQNMILSGWQDGNIRIHQRKDKNDDEEEEEDQNKEQMGWEMVGILQANKKVECMEVSGDNQHLAVGCDDKQLTVWDLNTRENVFTAKGFKADWLGLVDKPWITCMNWRPQDDRNSQIIVGTAIHKVKLYDYKRQKRPVQHFKFGEARITQVECEQDGNYVWVSNGTGHVYRWDLRKNVQHGGLRGVAGSIRGLKLNPFKNPNKFNHDQSKSSKKYSDDDDEDEDDDDDMEDGDEGVEDVEKKLVDGFDTQLASCGLDRWCRLHNASTRKPLTKVYMKQQLTGCAWMPVLKGEEFQLGKSEQEQSIEESEALDSQRPKKKSKIS